MAAEVTQKQNVILPEVMGQMIDAKIEALAKITPYATVDTTLQGVPGDTKTVPCWQFIGDAEDVAEGAEVETRKLTATSTTFTIKKAMVSVGLTQESINSGLGDPVGQAETQIAKSIVGKVDNDLMDAVYTASNTVTSSDVINYSGIVEAVCAFEDEEDGIEKVMFIHPAQEKALLTDPDFLSADKFTAGVAVNGSIGKIAGCWIKKSKKVQLKSGSYLNPIIKLQPDSAETEYTEDELPALTIFLKADTSVDAEWFPKKQQHDITGAKYYGVALTNDAKVVIAKFKATASSAA
jgi:N4-gp56 family major capsid protein